LLCVQSCGGPSHNKPPLQRKDTYARPFPEAPHRRHKVAAAPPPTRPRAQMLPVLEGTLGPRGPHHELRHILGRRLTQPRRGQVLFTLHLHQPGHGPVKGKHLVENLGVTVGRVPGRRVSRSCPHVPHTWGVRTGVGGVCVWGGRRERSGQVRKTWPRRGGRQMAVPRLMCVCVRGCGGKCQG
jgi:hypothetical protein